MIERHDGHTNLSYFGTGETFIFRLVPDTVCYHWNQSPCHIGTQTNAKSKYVFMDTKPLEPKQDVIDNKPKKSNRKKSFKRSLSLSSKSSKSSSDSKTEKNDSYPASRINVRRNATSVPRHLYLGKSFDLGDGVPSKTATKNVDNASEKRRISTKATATFDVSYIRKTKTEEIENPKVIDRRISEPAKKSMLKITKKTGFGDSFEVIDEETSPESVVPADVLPQINEHSVTKNAAELFISCDNSRLIIGGG